MAAPKGFICYARKNMKAVKSFHDEHLRTIERQYGVDFWWDTHIEGGEAWQREVAAAIAAADIFLLMVSPQWLASDYIQTVEMAMIGPRVGSGSAIVVPILISKC
jgi:hypothetical protein